MKKLLVVGCWLLVACAPIFAETNIIDGVTYICEDGICRMIEDEKVKVKGEGEGEEKVKVKGEGEGEGQGERSRSTKEEEDSSTHHSSLITHHSVRMAMGYMEPDAFLSFLQDEDGATATWMTTRDFSGWKIVVMLLAVLLGGLAMNLTPCVLPMIPINLMIIGKSASRGAWYGLGITIAYGTLGVLAAVGGLAFGSIQSNPWFNLGVALVFVALALSLFGVFFIDFSKSRSKFRGGAFLMGMLAAVLAGACVAPILIAVLLWTAGQFASGNYFALGLPFVLGLGMALPWPFVGAGLSVLPKPGAWMAWVNRGFGVIVLGFACWYGHLSWIGFKGGEKGATGESGAIEATPATLHLHLSPSPSHKPILVDCWATWCKNCSAMEKTTLADAKVREALKKFTVIRLQAEDIQALKKLPGFEGVMGLPAFVIFE